VEEPMKQCVKHVINIIDYKHSFDDLCMGGEPLESHATKICSREKIYRIDDKVCNSEPNYCFSIQLCPIFFLPRHRKTRINFVFLI
jgi:hypothetical protein